jgi:hypothetical protein
MGGGGTGGASGGNGGNFAGSSGWGGTMGGGSGYGGDLGGLGTAGTMSGGAGGAGMDGYGGGGMAGVSGSGWGGAGGSAGGRSIIGYTGQGNVKFGPAPTFSAPVPTTAPAPMHAAPSQPPTSVHNKNSTVIGKSPRGFNANMMNRNNLGNPGYNSLGPEGFGLGKPSVGFSNRGVSTGGINSNAKGGFRGAGYGGSSNFGGPR